MTAADIAFRMVEQCSGLKYVYGHMLSDLARATAKSYNVQNPSEEFIAEAVALTKKALGEIFR